MKRTVDLPSGDTTSVLVTFTEHGEERGWDDWFFRLTPGAHAHRCRESCVEDSGFADWLNRGGWDPGGGERLPVAYGRFRRAMFQEQET